MANDKERVALGSIAASAGLTLAKTATLGVRPWGRPGFLPAGCGGCDSGCQ